MRFLFAGFFILVSHIATAAPEAMKGDNLHARTWNQFAQNILAFHQQRVKGIDVEIKEKAGGYANLPDFYTEQSVYLDGQLIAIISWEKDNPKLLHTIEAFVRDEQGRVIRDYSAAYLPQYRNAPTQTLISFHRYNDGLHAFRSFDASGYRIIERCTGSYKGKEVDFIVDEDEIAEALDDAHLKQGVMMSSDYKNCFGNDLPVDVGEYISPR